MIETTATELLKKKFEKKSKYKKKAARSMTDDERTKIKNYISMINLAVVVERSLDICLYRKNRELNEKLIKLF